MNAVLEVFISFLKFGLTPLVGILHTFEILEEELEPVGQL